MEASRKDHQGEGARTELADSITEATAVLHFLGATTTALNQWFEGEAVKALERKVSTELEKTHPQV